MDVPATLGLFKQAIDAAKILRDTERAWDEATFKLKIIELIGALSEGQATLADMGAELREREAMIDALRRELADIGSVEYRPPFYWRPAQGDKPEDGPFCQACLDSKHRLIRVQKTVITRMWKCEVCKTDFRWPDGPAEPLLRPSRA